MLRYRFGFTFKSGFDITTYGHVRKVRKNKTRKSSKTQAAGGRLLRNNRPKHSLTGLCSFQIHVLQENDCIEGAHSLCPYKQLYYAA